MSEHSIRILFFVCIIAVGLLQAFAHGTIAYSTDDCSYLDQAVLFSRFNFLEGVNFYWSPLYPFLAGLMIKCFNVPLEQQLFAVKLMNVGILAATLIAFDYFLSKFLNFAETLKSAENSCMPSRKQWLILSGSLFAWMFLTVGGVHQATPDYLVAAFLFLATGLALQIDQKPTTLRFALMGVAMGFGYLAKASMIPAAVALIVLAAIRCPKMNVKIGNAVVALACAVLIASPYWSILTTKKGQFDLGSSSAMNYMLWIAKDYSLYGDNREEVENSLTHHISILSKRPRIAVFEDMLPATFPPWFDPGYFSDGLKIKFDFGASLFALALNLVTLFCLFGWQLVLFYIAGRTKAKPLNISFTEVWRSSVVWLPSVLIALGICLIISLPLGFATPRYFAANVVLIYLCYFALLRYPATDVGRRALGLAIATACLVSLVFVSAKVVEESVRLVQKKTDLSTELALALNDAGLYPGDKVVFIGKEGGDWARVAGLRIVGLVESYANEHGADDAIVLSSIVETLKTKTGAKAAIYFPEPISENLIEEERFIQGYRDAIAAIARVKLTAPPERTKFSDAALRDWRSVNGSTAYVYLLR
ncbi:MAG: hypothetical protein SGJ27_07715 [Candidatus Melainabacteria bacterium]|nr:hypothetical protein [Candidatus Melainabacteria bacterium]